MSVSSRSPRLFSFRSALRRYSQPTNGRDGVRRRFPAWLMPLMAARVMCHARSASKQSKVGWAHTLSGREREEFRVLKNPAPLPSLSEAHTGVRSTIWKVLFLLLCDHTFR
jgi:hypothetical protein